LASLPWSSSLTHNFLQRLSLGKAGEMINVYQGSMLDPIESGVHCCPNLAIMALTPEAVEVFLGVLGFQKPRPEAASLQPQPQSVPGGADTR